MGHWENGYRPADWHFIPGRDKHVALFHRSKSTVPLIKNHIQCWSDGMREKQCSSVHPNGYIAWCQCLEYMELDIHALNIPPRRAAPVHIQPSCLKVFKHTQWLLPLHDRHRCSCRYSLGLNCRGLESQHLANQSNKLCVLAHTARMKLPTRMFVTRNSNNLSTARRVTKEFRNQFGTRFVTTCYILYKLVTWNNEPMKMWRFTRQFKVTTQ